MEGGGNWRMGEDEEGRVGIGERWERVLGR